MPLLKNILIHISGKGIAQRLLQYNVSISQYLMGIGSGGGVNTSGEIAIIKKLKELKSSNYCLFDIGSNKGQFLNLILSSFSDNERFHVHCFEPGSYTFRILIENTKEDPNVTLNNIGMGRERGEFELFYNESGSGLASLTKRRLDHFGIEFSKSEKVTIDTVDNYCLMNDIGNIDLLKIDVEGHELDVLYGANNMFKNNSIRMVSFEFGGCNIDTRTFFQDFFYFFQKVNMQLFRITPSGYLCPLPHYVELYEQFRTTNFLAINRLLKKY